MIPSSDFIDDHLLTDKTIRDAAAFEKFFKENFSGFCKFCQLKYDFDNDLARETVHAAFIKLWENRHALTADQPPTAYMYAIISNSCLDILRHEKVKLQHEKFITHSVSHSYSDGYNTIDFRELSKETEKAIAELPEQMRKIFRLSRDEGLRYAEIAGRLGISVKTVETQMSRALVKLREKLHKYLILLVLLLVQTIDQIFF